MTILKSTTTAAAAAAAIALGLGLQIDIRAPQGDRAGLQAPVLSVGIAPAEAQPARRVARRTARRTTRRTTARYNSIAALPAGCVLRAGYHYCGGVYYRPVVEAGTTVYVVVTP